MTDTPLEEDCFGSCTIIRTEIPSKRKGYILIRKAAREHCEEEIDRSCAALVRAGAEEVYAGCPDRSADLPPTEFRTPNYVFRFAHEMDELELELPAAPFAGAPEGLALQRLTRESAEDFLRIYQRTFFSVPNSATYTKEDTDRFLAEEEAFQAGFLTKDGRQVGFYEISFEQEVPEISGIGILEEERGQGLGEAFLRLLFAELRGQGRRTVGLQVSTANPGAYRLYREIGFQKNRTVSRWYRYTRQA